MKGAARSAGTYLLRGLRLAGQDTDLPRGTVARAELHYYLH